MTAYHRVSNPLAVSTSTKQAPFSALRCAALLLLTAETEACVAVPYRRVFARRSVRTPLVVLDVMRVVV